VREVRAFAIENALYWLREYRFDGLRLDAVNTIVETGEFRSCTISAVAAGKLAAETGRHIHLVLENSETAQACWTPCRTAARQISRTMER